MQVVTGNFDSSYDDTAARPPFITLTLIIVVVFVIVSNVVLLNLIIARMSAVHERIDAHSFQEWQLLRAVRTQRFLLLVKDNLSKIIAILMTFRVCRRKAIHSACCRLLSILSLQCSSGFIDMLSNNR